jgi:hypothetical protein
VTRGKEPRLGDRLARIDQSTAAAATLVSEHQSGCWRMTFGWGDSTLIPARRAAWREEEGRGHGPSDRGSRCGTRAKLGLGRRKGNPEGPGYEMAFRSLRHECGGAAMPGPSKAKFWSRGGET